MKMLSLFLLFSCLFCKGGLCANNPNARLRREDIRIKGDDTSVSFDHEKQFSPPFDNESPPFKSETPSPPSPLSDPAKPSLLDEKLAMDQRFVTSSFEKTSGMVEEEGFDHANEGGRIGTQKMKEMKETGDLVGKDKDGLLASCTYLSKSTLTEKIMELTREVLQFFALSNVYGISVWVCFVVGGVWTRTFPKIRRVERSIGVFLIIRCLRSSYFGLFSVRVYMMLLSLCFIALYTFFIEDLIFELLSDILKLQRLELDRTGERDERRMIGGMQFKVYCRAEDVSEIQNLERQLIFLSRLSDIGDIFTFITLATEVACIVASIGNSLSMMV